MKEANRNRRIMGFPDEFWIGFVLMIGIFLKIVYDVSVPYFLTTHQIGEWKEIINDIPNSGQLGLIQYYFTYKHLPNFDPAQIACYRNQPLFYTLAAIILDIFFVKTGWALGTVLHCIQCLNGVCVIIGLFCCQSVLHKWGVKGRRYVFTLILLMFYPGFYHLGASLDYHGLAFMLEAITLNLFLGWYVYRKMRFLVGGSIAFGLAMMTDLMATWLIIPIGAVFACVYFYDGRSVKEKPFKEAGISLGVSFVMGWWYPIRNLIRFGTNPFGFDVETAAWQHLEYYPWYKRLLLPSPESLKYLHQSTETSRQVNIWGQTLKTTIVNENALNLELSSTYTLAEILLWLIIIFLVMSFIMTVAYCLLHGFDMDDRAIIASSLVGMLLIYVITCFVNPVISAMNAMKVPFLLIFLMPGYCLFGNIFAQDSRIVSIISRIMEILIVSISMLSAFLFGFYAV